MKHYSANLEQGAQVDLGSLTITSGDSLISANNTKTGSAKAFSFAFAATDYINGTGDVVDNTAFDTVVLSDNTLTFSRIGTGADVDIDLSTLDLGVDTNPSSGTIPIAVDATGDAYDGTGETFADSSLSQDLVNGVVNAAMGLNAVAGNISAAAGNVSASANLSAGGTLSVTGTSTLTGAVTATTTGGTGQGIVVSSSAGLLSRVTEIPASFLPDIVYGDVYSYSAGAAVTTAADALTAFYGQAPSTATLGNDTPFNIGDIACIDYGTGDTVTLLYVGGTSGTGVNNAGHNGTTAAADWKNISSSADGIMDVNSGNTDTITVTGGQVKTVTAITGAVADGATTLVTGDGVHDYLEDTAIQLTGDVLAADTDLTIGGTTMISTSLAIDTVDLAEINAAQDATPANDAGKVLTIDSAGTGLEWVTNPGGNASKLAFAVAAQTTMSFDVSSINSGISGNSIPSATVAVYELDGSDLSQIIPDSIKFAASGMCTVVFGKSFTGRVVFTG